MDRYSNVASKVILDKRLYYVLFPIGAVVLISGLVLNFTLATLVSVLVPLKENSWRLNVSKYETARQRDVYLFNWTNIDDFLNYGSVPDFKQIGPFSFEEKWIFKNEKWSENWMQYDRYRSWTFLPESSPNYDVLITNVNVILPVIVNRDRNVTKELNRRVIDYALKNTSCFSTTQSAKNWIFEGYVDRRIPRVKDLTFPFERFAFFLDENSTEDGTWNRSVYDHLLSWEVSFSKNESVKTNFPVNDQFFTYSDPFVEVVPSLCSEVKLEGYTQFQEHGLNVMRYGVGKNVSSYINSNRIRQNCVESSMPFTISLPHFEGRSPPNITGLSPQNIDWPQAEVDTITGITLQSHLTYQVNIKISRLEWSETYLQNITEVEIPLMWFAEKTIVSRSVEEDLINYYNFNSKKIAAVSLFCTGCLLLAFTKIMLLIRRRLIGTISVVRLENEEED